jgi:hypothetical protein
VHLPAAGTIRLSVYGRASILATALPVGSSDTSGRDFSGRLWEPASQGVWVRGRAVISGPRADSLRRGQRVSEEFPSGLR